jgi:hypothetical protein
MRSPCPTGGLSRKIIIVITVDIESLIRMFAHSVCRKVTQYGEVRRIVVASCQQSNSTKDCLFCWHCMQQEWVVLPKPLCAKLGGTKTFVAV